MLVVLLQFDCVANLTSPELPRSLFSWHTNDTGYPLISDVSCSRSSGCVNIIVASPFPLFPIFWFGCVLSSSCCVPAFFESQVRRKTGRWLVGFLVWRKVYPIVNNTVCRAWFGLLLTVRWSGMYNKQRNAVCFDTIRSLLASEWKLVYCQITFSV